jgi:hypothetical protein
VPLLTARISCAVKGGLQQNFFEEQQPKTKMPQNKHCVILLPAIAWPKLPSFQGRVATGIGV